MAKNRREEAWRSEKQTKEQEEADLQEWSIQKQTVESREAAVIIQRVTSQLGTIKLEAGAGW